MGWRTSDAAGKRREGAWEEPEPAPGARTPPNAPRGSQKCDPQVVARLREELSGESGRFAADF